MPAVKESDDQWSVKYRPRRLDDIVGNDSTKVIVKKFLARRNSHALLLSGPSGCGKTTLAKIIGKAFSGGMASNIDERNVAAEGGKDDARSMVESARYQPMNSDGCKIFILEEAHGLTKQATAALLRPVEEPTHNRQIWIFVTDRPWMLDVAILNRCRKFPVEAPTEKELAIYLWRIMQKEQALSKLDDKHRKQAAMLIARYSGCIPREAVQLLQNADDADLRRFDALKDYVITARAGGDVAMDRVAAIILYNIFNIKLQTEQRVGSIVRGYAAVDPIGLLNRLIFGLHALMLFALAKKPNYVVNGILHEFKGLRPDVEDMTDVLLTLGRLRQQLREIVIDPSTVILPLILECVFKLQRGK